MAAKRVYALEEKLKIVMEVGEQYHIISGGQKV